MNQAVEHEDKEPRRQVATTVTPADMLRIAVEQGADLEKMEKLMDLQERWEKNEAKKAYVRAMTAFKADPPVLTKNKQVRFANRNGDVTEYKHATLDHVCEVIGAALSKVGISYAWETGQSEGGLISVTCVLTHDDGHSTRTTLTAGADQSGGKNSIQAVGSTVTYLQRYTLLAATGMATEEQDDDGKTADVPAGLSDDQIAEIRKALKVAGKTEEALCKLCNVEAIEQIPPQRFQAVMNRIKKAAQQ